MQAISTLENEHKAVLHVLEQVEKAASAAAAGQPVPKDVFADIDEFFRTFVDRCHHSKEETVLFPRLASSDLPQLLESEHAQGRELAQAYSQAASSYTLADRASAVALKRAAAEYASLLRDHIAKEDAALWPAVESELSASDRELVDAFQEIETERIGAGTHERLHAMIETLPSRIAPFVATA